MRKMEFKEANKIAKRALNGNLEERANVRAHFGILVGINLCYSCIHKKGCNGKQMIPKDDFVQHCNFYKYEGDDKDES